VSGQQTTTKRTLTFLRGALEIKTRATAEGRGKKGRFYKPLQKEFRRDGFAYRQIARGDTARFTSKRGMVVLTRVLVMR
jgi:hypothetical protein